jgi:hypothetical protein
MNKTWALYCGSFTRKHREKGVSHPTDSLSTYISQAGFRIWAWDGDSISNMRVLGPSEAHSCVPEEVQRHCGEVLESLMHPAPGQFSFLGEDTDEHPSSCHGEGTDEHSRHIQCFFWNNLGSHVSPSNQRSLCCLLGKPQARDINPQSPLLTFRLDNGNYK